MDSSFGRITTEEVRTLDSQRDARQLIARKLSRLTQLKEARKNIVESISNLLEKDTEYMRLVDLKIEAAQKELAQKREVLRTSEGVSLKIKADDIGDEIKELTDDLSTSLVAFTDATGQNEIQDEDGNVYQLDKRVKVRRGQLKLF